MSNIDKLLALAEEHDAKATKGPWCWEQTGLQDNSWAVGVAVDDEDQNLTGLIEPGQGEVVEGICSDLPDGNFSDAAFVAASRTAWPATAKALKVAREALDEIAHNSPTQDAIAHWYSTATDALAELDRIATEVTK